MRKPVSYCDGVAEYGQERDYCRLDGAGCQPGRPAACSISQSTIFRSNGVPSSSLRYCAAYSFVWTSRIRPPDIEEFGWLMITNRFEKSGDIRKSEDQNTHSSFAQRSGWVDPDGTIHGKQARHNRHRNQRDRRNREA